MTIPKGYTLYGTNEGDKTITLAVTDFSYMNKEAPKEIEYKGTRYKRGMIDTIPLHLSGHVCSMRIYHEIQENPLTEGSTKGNIKIPTDDTRRPVGKPPSPSKQSFSMRDMRAAWKEGKRNERMYGCSGKDIPDFYAWFDKFYGE